MNAQNISLFIGSSVEGLDVAYTLQESLQFDCEATVWSQGVFSPSTMTLPTLIAEVPRCDFAVFVFTPDDERFLRGAKGRVPRDNVVFEFGLFVGGIGLDRSFIVHPRGGTAPGLPTDLLGLTPLTYQSDRGDGRLLAALGPVSNQIRRSIRTLGNRQSTEIRPDAFGPAHSPNKRKKKGGPRRAWPQFQVIPDFEELWNSPPLQESRAVLSAGVALNRYDEAGETAEPHILKIFFLLESMADAVLAKQWSEVEAQQVFRDAVLKFWPFAHSFLAPPNHADEFWSPLPKLAVIFQRWKIAP